jgi:hypothetical protein
MDPSSKLRKLLEASATTPVVDRTFPLDEFPRRSAAHAELRGRDVHPTSSGKEFAVLTLPHWLVKITDTRGGFPPMPTALASRTIRPVAAAVLLLEVTGMDVLVIETQNGITPRTEKAPPKGTETVTADLEELRRGTRAFEVAHVRDKEHYERLKRALGLAVVILTTVTGTAIVTSLAASQNASTAAKIVVGILSVLSAVVAAVNEKGPFGDQVTAHGDTATSFIKLHRKAIVLDRDWMTGKIDQDEAEKQLGELEASYDDLKETSPDLRDYMSAHKFVETEEQQHGK